MWGDCFSVLVILILHRFDLALHASLMVVYLCSVFLLFFIKKKIKKIGGDVAGILFFFFSWYVRYCI
jgi:FtsH-binding integral membrane protein